MNERKSMTAQVEQLRSMSVADLVPRYRELYGKDPRSKNRTWLWRRCAWKLQENAHGGLSSAAKRRLEELIAEIEIPPAKEDRTAATKIDRRRPQDPAPGSTLVREYKGRELRLTVLDNGFELDGVVYSSLSAAAHAATGSRWNGRLFWKLTTRKPTSTSPKDRRQRR